MLAPNLMARIEQPNGFAGLGFGGLNLCAFKLIASATGEPEKVFSQILLSTNMKRITE
jgi:hypothetical protein